jgi:hypothetical protein
MNRLGFLKRLGALAVTAIVAEPILEALATPHTITQGDWIIYKVDGYTIHWKKLPIFDTVMVGDIPMKSYRMIFLDANGNESSILP